MIVLLDSCLVESRGSLLESNTAVPFRYHPRLRTYCAGPFRFPYLTGYLCLVWLLFYFAKKKNTKKKTLCRLLANYVLLRESTG